jgi:hypothetical protein
VCDGWFVEGFQAAAHPCSSAKAADRLAAAGIAAELALPVVPTGRDDRAEPGATDRAFLTCAEFSASFRPGDFPSCRQLRVVLLCLERAPERVDGCLAHRVQLGSTTPALLVVIVGFSGRGRSRPDLRSLQPSTGVLVASQFAVAFTQAAGAKRRVGSQPGSFAKLMGVDPMRNDRMVCQGAQPTPIAPRTALSLDARPQPGLVDESVNAVSWHRNGPATTGPTRASKSGLDRGWWQAEAAAAATSSLSATYPGDPSSPRRSSRNSPTGVTPPPPEQSNCTRAFTPHPPGMQPARNPLRERSAPPTAEPSEFSWDRERRSEGRRAPDAHRSQAEQAHGHRDGSGGREERGRPDGELAPQEDAGDSCGRTREP